MSANRNYPRDNYLRPAPAEFERELCFDSENGEYFLAVPDDTEELLALFGEPPAPARSNAPAIDIEEQEPAPDSAKAFLGVVKLALAFAFGIVAGALLVLLNL